LQPPSKDKYPSAFGFNVIITLFAGKETWATFVGEKVAGELWLLGLEVGGNSGSIVFAASFPGLQKDLDPLRNENRNGLSPCLADPRTHAMLA
jgi:hypothetical protein